MIIGAGEFRYEVARGWGRLPHGWRCEDVSDVAVDSEDNVFLFTRMPQAIIIFDREGRFLGSWGSNLFTHPHGLSITADDVVWCVDDRDHTVRKFSTDGTLLQTLGTPHQSSDSGYYESSPGVTALQTIVRGAPPFNRPTCAAVAPDGDVYCSDGYGNARIHRFSPAGELILSWGEPGCEEGQFHLPHSIWVDGRSRVIVSDRENHRIQFFNTSGDFLSSWDVVRPQDVHVGHDGYFYTGEGKIVAGKADMSGNVATRTRSAKVTIRDAGGNEVAMLGHEDPLAPDGLLSAHGICVDSHGNIYVAELTQAALSRKGPGYGPDFRAIKKFIRV